ncbi:MAG: DUF3137 domain-containing protein [Lachnospiraceae bacterium]|nr:DUF3137 domain-containing protein [Lachnospiraceae bacterium]
MNTIDVIRDLETMRKSIQFKRILSVICMFGMFFVGMIINGSGNLSFAMVSPMLFLVAFAGGGILAYMANKELKQFKHLYKQNFVVGVLNEMFGHVVYNPEYGFSEMEVGQFGITQLGNRYSSEDYIEGECEGVRFRQSDVTIKRVVRSGKSTHTYVHFNGRMFEFECPMSNNTSTLVFSKNYQYPGHGIGMRYEKIELENAAFNKQFKVKSIDSIDAFYILTPQMMECVQNIQRKGGTVGLHFVKDKLYLGINAGGQGAFDANMNRPLVYVDEVEKIKRDAAVIFDIIRTLKLDENAKEDRIAKGMVHGSAVDDIAAKAAMNAMFGQAPAESKFGFSLKK